MIYEEEVIECCKCTECGESIYYGEKYFNIPSPTVSGEFYPYCESCVNDASTVSEYEPYEPDGCDLYKAKIERELCNDR